SVGVAGRAGNPLRNRLPKISGNGVPAVLWLADNVPPGLELKRLVKALVPSRTNATEKPPRRTVWPEFPNSLCIKPLLPVFGAQVMPTLGAKLPYSVSNVFSPFENCTNLVGAPVKVPGAKRFPSPDSP